MEIIGYHGTKTPFDSFTPGGLTIDRMVGPHFSKTPALANRFALRNPAGKGRGPRYGGHVVPVKLCGRVYKVNQNYADFPGRYSPLSHPEQHYWLGLFAVDYVAIPYDIGRVVLPKRPDLATRLAPVFNFADAKALMTHIRKTKEWGLAGYTQMREHRELQADVAQAYRDILVERGYGMLQYINTAKKEQVGDLDDQTCFIALTPPQFHLADATRKRRKARAKT